MCSTFLKIDNFSLSIDEKILFDQLSIEIASGDRVGITGPSGMGKTSLIKAIINAYTSNQSSEGSISFPTKINIGYCPQSGGLLPWFTVEKNIRVLARPESLNEQTSLINEFQIEHILDKYPTQISGGERQRVSLLISLLRSPNILILDEPLTGVNLKLKYKILQHIDLFISEDKSLLLISHDLDILTLLSHRVLIMNDRKWDTIELTTRRNNDVLSTMDDDSFSTNRSKILTKLGLGTID